MTGKIKLGVSACLLGEYVRYDGGHAHDRFLTDTLGQFVEYVPVCPEVECGMPVPREAVRLVGSPDSPRLMTVKTGIDHTERMRSWAEKRLESLEADDLCGFIFKSKSPSSGMKRVKVYTDAGVTKTGVGIWARMFMEHFPLLPVEDEGRLHDPGIRENFIERIFVFMRWRELIGQGATPGRLIDFHTRHKLLVMAHSPQAYRALGKLIAEVKTYDTARFISEYITLLTAALKLAATAKKNVNVLNHLMGYFRKQLSTDEKQELIECIESYYRRFVPLIVPVTLINHYVRKYGQTYLANQYYLNPHPIELALRNHV